MVSDFYIYFVTIIFLNALFKIIDRILHIFHFDGKTIKREGGENDTSFIGLQLKME